MLLVSFILLSVHQVPSSATSVSVLVLWWFEAGSEVQDGVGGSSHPSDVAEPAKLPSVEVRLDGVEAEPLLERRRREVMLARVRARRCASVPACRGRARPC